MFQELLQILDTAFFNCAVAQRLVEVQSISSLCTRNFPHYCQKVMPILTTDEISILVMEEKPTVINRSADVLRNVTS